MNKDNFEEDSVFGLNFVWKAGNPNLVFTAMRQLYDGILRKYWPTPHYGTLFWPCQLFHNEEESFLAEHGDEIFTNCFVDKLVWGKKATEGQCKTKYQDDLLHIHGTRVAE